MNKEKIKILGLGFLGGVIPLTAFLLFSKPYSNHQDTITGKTKNSNLNTIRTNLNSMPTATPTDFVTASEKTLNSVVHVTTIIEKTTFQRDPFYEFFYGPGAGGREFKQRGQGSGSGVIISENGYIVTNNHVINDATEIKVTLNDGSKYDAEVIGTDPSTDIAVIKIKAKNLQPIVIGNSDNVRIGEWVLAVGNPFNLTSTVTAGIISAKARNINLFSNNRNNNGNIPIESFIQTDAAVNPGNSGGALVNTRGELIGINTAIASQTGSYTGYSFAVPVNLVKKVMKDLIDYGIVQRGYLGIKISDVTQELKDKEELPDLKGVYVAEVIEDGAADKGGIKDGDIILKIGSKEINSVAELQEEIGSRRPGDKVSVTIRNKKGDVEIKECILRNKEGETKLVEKEEISKTTALGATFKELSGKEKKELAIDYGVKIKSINAGKLKGLGLKEGMIISKINNIPVKSVEQLTSKLNNTKGGVLLEVITETGRKEYVGFGL